MNDNARAWVRGLRSGHYNQGRGQLTRALLNEEGKIVRFEHCVFGVACDIIGPRTGAKLTEVYNRPIIGGAREIIYGYDGDVAALPSNVQRALGLRTRNGLVGQYESSMTSLMTLNDSGGMTLPELGDFIMEHHKELFID